jgi:short-subunit dehydrogenase
MKFRRENRPKRVVLITGGSQGIGAACVREFLTAGWNVAVLALPGSELDWLVPLKVTICSGDVTSADTRKAAVEATLAAYGRIDVLINNAGVGLYGFPTEVSADLFSQLLAVNVIAPLAMAQLVISAMQNQGFGTIVNMGSVAGCVSLPWAAAYSASKAALHSVHDSIRRELRDSPIHVLKVCPGIVDTDFRTHVLAGQPPELVRNLRRIIPAEAVAVAILHAVERKRKTTFAPGIGAVFSIAGALAPWFMDIYLAQFMNSHRRLSRLNSDLQPESASNE